MTREKIPAFYFEAPKLKEIAEKYKAEFLANQPFPHIVIDDFLPEDVLKILIEEFPGIKDIDWCFYGPGETKHTKDPRIEKVGSSDESQMRPFTRHFMQQLNSATFLKFVEELTGVGGIISDPTYNQCGLHSTGPGGRLMIHTDLNRHPLGNRFHQRYNVILFLNENWKEEYGGHLELWNRDATQCIQRIAPIANRMVLFDTGRYSFHGHPEPLNCPEDRRRNSLAVYYYVLDRALDENYGGIQNHVTWVAQNAEDKKYLKEKKLKKVIQKCIPPILIDFARRLKHG